MLFPALGTVTAMWLLVTPLLGLETGFRAAFAVSAGVAALILAASSVWSRSAGRALALVGAFVAVMNFFLFEDIATTANFISCGAALVIAGMAPQPAVEAAAHTIDRDAAVVALIAPEAENTVPLKAAA